VEGCAFKVSSDTGNSFPIRSGARAGGPTRKAPILATRQAACHTDGVSRRPRPPARRSLLVTIAVAVCVLLQMSDAAHFVLVRHGICREHGEAIHVAHGAHAVQAVVAPASRVTGLSVAPAGDTDADEHDHCPFAPGATGRIASLRGPVQTLAAGHTALASPELATVRPSPSALRLLAPKTSPPFALV